jgi:hypothetical protein
MEVSTGPLEASTRIQERSSNNPADERRQPSVRRLKIASPADDDAALPEDTEGHQLDDIA